MLAEKYASEIEGIFARFPEDQRRAAVLPLLYLAQREYGYITPEAVREVSDLTGASETHVGGLIGFYTLLHDHPAGKYRLQVCTDLPCALRGAEAFAASLCENLGIKLGETTEDGLITVEEVKCLAACDRAPMFQLQTPDRIQYYEHQTLETALELIRELREGEHDA